MVGPINERRSKSLSRALFHVVVQQRDSHCRVPCMHVNDRALKSCYSASRSRRASRSPMVKLTSSAVPTQALAAAAYSRAKLHKSVTSSKVYCATRGTRRVMYISERPQPARTWVGGWVGWGEDQALRERGGAGHMCKLTRGSRSRPRRGVHRGRDVEIT
jgi:hypothetical protein